MFNFSNKNIVKLPVISVPKQAEGVLCCFAVLRILDDTETPPAAATLGGFLITKDYSFKHKCLKCVFF